MGERDRDDAGRYTETYPESVFLTAIRKFDLPTTGDIADEVGCPNATAYRRLRSLEDGGHVTSRRIGGSNVWEIAE